KESTDHSEAVAVAIALARESRQFWFHFGDLEVGPPAARKRVVAIENLASGERHPGEWGGVGLRIDPEPDPAVIFACLVQQGTSCRAAPSRRSSTPTRNGTSRRSSISCMSRRSPTATTTASAISPG